MKFHVVCSAFGKFIRSLLLIISLVAIGQSVFAAAPMDAENQCLKRLTNNYEEDSRSLRVDLDQLTIRDFNNDDLAEAIVVVRQALKTVGCSYSAVNFGEGPYGKSRSHCQRMSSELDDFSRVCYIETNLGYFFVTYDMLTHANVIYNRWD